MDKWDTLDGGMASFDGEKYHRDGHTYSMKAYIRKYHAPNFAKASLTREAIGILFPDLQGVGLPEDELNLLYRYRYEHRRVSKDQEPQIMKWSLKCLGMRADEVCSFLPVSKKEVYEWAGRSDRLGGEQFSAWNGAGYYKYWAFDFFHLLTLTPAKLRRWRREDQKAAKIRKAEEKKESEERREREAREAEERARLDEEARRAEEAAEAEAAKKRAPLLVERLRQPVRTASTIVLDTETTGLDPDDGCAIVELAIVDEAGDILFCERIRPPQDALWTAGAQAVNGITKEDVRMAFSLDELRPVLQPILSAAKRIVGYNTSFDLCFIQAAGFSISQDAEIVDVMEDFAAVYDDWSDYFQSYTWQKLVACADYYHYAWQGDAHGALADALATLYCWPRVERDYKNIDFNARREQYSGDDEDA